MLRVLACENMHGFLEAIMSSQRMYVHRETQTVFVSLILCVWKTGAY